MLQCLLLRVLSSKRLYGYVLPFLASTLVLCIFGCNNEVLNSPYPLSWIAENTVFYGFQERPKHLDPARSYSSNEVVFNGQIYEPPLQYHYLRRPYQLIPLTAAQMPRLHYRDASGNILPPDLDVQASNHLIAESIYTITINRGIKYQPHPAFAVDASLNPRYFNLKEEDMVGIRSIADFAYSGTKELTAEDYVYGIKRLAHPQVQSPILDFLAGYIIGLKEYSTQLSALVQKNPKQFIDLREHDISGVRVIDRYTFEIDLKGQYPQFLYWLAMPFFSPIPYEVDRFYAQPLLGERNISLDWFPVGTGPYYMAVNEPNRRIELRKNPNFRGELYPSDGEPADLQNGLLKYSGEAMPFIDRVIYSVEKEAIPSWSKFLQGYYDVSGISSDSFDQAVRLSDTGDVTLTEEMEKKGIRLVTSVRASTMYTGFNMLDPVVGGYSESARKLRLAVAIALDTEEFISIFANGRGIPAQGPIPPEIFGYKEGAAGMDPTVYDWNGRKPVRKSLAYAKQLLAEAGYANGRKTSDGEPLVLYFDTVTSGAESKSEFDWLTKKFETLGVQLIIRATDYNTFQDKMSKGTEQIYQWGWNADYPDAENFLFLLYGPNGKVKNGGENASNYDNPEFNELFEQMRNIENGQKRAEIIDKMVDIARRDVPWVWGYHPKSYALVHKWLTNNKPNLMANNTLKYLRVEPRMRQESIARWNNPIFYPLIMMLIGVAALGVGYFSSYRKQQQAKLKTGNVIEGGKPD